MEVESPEKFQAPNSNREMASAARKKSSSSSFSSSSYRTRVSHLLRLQDKFEQEDAEDCGRSVNQDAIKERRDAGEIPGVGDGDVGAGARDVILDGLPVGGEGA